MSSLVVAEAMHYEGGELVFLAPVGFIPGYLEQILLEFPDSTSRELRILVKTSRSLGDGRFLGVGTVLEGMQADEKLPELAETAGRQAPRLPLRTGVNSRELPNYKALTLDCSLSGLQLQTDGPLPVGQVLDLSLDLNESGPSVPCQARVTWCRHVPEDGKYRAGLEFVRPVAEMELALSEVSQAVATPVAMRGALLSHVPSLRTHPPGEKLSPVVGEIQSLTMQESSIKISVLLDDGHTHNVAIANTRAVRDNREKLGSKIANLGYTETPGAARYRFLTPTGEAVLDIEAARRQRAAQPGTQAP